MIKNNIFFIFASPLDKNSYRLKRLFFLANYFLFCKKIAQSLKWLGSRKAIKLEGSKAHSLKWLGSRKAIKLEGWKL
jgi:hypothetical protein